VSGRNSSCKQKDMKTYRKELKKMDEPVQTVRYVNLINI